MARTKGAVNTSTMLKAIREAGRYREGLDTASREAIKAVYEAVINAKPVPPTVSTNIAGAVVITPAKLAAEAVSAQKPPEPTEWQKRVEARHKAAKDRIERDQSVARASERAPVPCSPDSIVDTTVIEGRTVSEWAALIEGRSEQAAPGYGRFVVVDNTDVPGWATWAIDKWKRLGSPTFSGRIREQIEGLLSKADEQDGKAVKEDREAAELEKDKNPKLAKKKRDAAAQKRTKAAELRKQADELMTQHNVKV